MRILIVSDAWEPQVNGVVRTLQATIAELRKAGHEVSVVSPDLFRSVPCPSYPEIRLALAGWRKVGRHIRAFAPQAIHISTEGPLGLAVRRWCLRNDFPFTTAYHTRFPEYVAARLPVSPKLVWRFIRWFHRPARHIMVATRSLARELAEQGLEQTMMWERGVDHDLFHPDRAAHSAYAGLPRPIQLYVGRVAVEKNIGAFLDIDRPGTKVIVGDGPALAALKAQHPGGLFNKGMGVRLSAKYDSGSTVTGGSAGDLKFGDLATFNLRFFMDLNQKPKLTEAVPFLKGSRLRLSVDNLFDAQRRITDANGRVPLNYQPGYIDPLGRYIELEWRKTF